MARVGLGVESSLPKDTLVGPRVWISGGLLRCDQECLSRSHWKVVGGLPLAILTIQPLNMIIP